MTIIEKMNGERFDLTKYGIPILKVGPVDIVYDSENIKGRAGRNRTTRYYGIRKLQLKLLLDAVDETDTIMLRDRLAEILDDAEDFYVYEQVSKGYAFEFPGESSFKNSIDQLKWKPHMYKRWRVERINNDGIEWNGLKGKRVIEYETSDLPFGETPFRSLDLQNTEKSWDIGLLAWGLGFEWDGTMPSYSFASNSFTVKNLGNVKLNPRHMPVKITVKGVFPSGFTLTNHSTGDVVSYTGSLSAGDTFTIDGVSYLKNNQHVTGDTNKKIMTLQKGDNQFSLNGGTVHSISFDIPFYYL